MRRKFVKIHLWLSVPFGLIITIISFSGAMLVFEPEIMELTKPHLYYADNVKEQRLAVGQLINVALKSMPKGSEVSAITISSDPKKSAQISFSKPSRVSIFIDPYTAEIKGEYKRAPFFRFMIRTHRWLLDSMKPDESIFWGKMVVGTSTLMFVFALISGLIIWLPKTVKSLKFRLKIDLTKGWKRFWYDLHVSAGFYSAIVLLVLALTGLTWSFSWYRTGFYSLLGVETTRRSSNNITHVKQPLEGDKTENDSDRFAFWESAYHNITTLNPDFSKISISNGKASLFNSNLGNQRAADSYYFNVKNGEITEVRRYDDSEAQTKLRGWIYSLHVGSWGGLTTRIITFLAALIGASLPLTGYYLWLKRIFRS